MCEVIDEKEYSVFKNGFSIKENESREPILIESQDKYGVFPINDRDTFRMYNQSISLFWTVEEVDLSMDVSDWNKKLNDNEKYFIKNILAFFASADGIVLENLAMRFLVEVQCCVTRLFYSFQIAMESIHSVAYGLSIDALITDKAERLSIHKSVTTNPIVQKKTKWAEKWLSSSRSFAERLVAFAAVECIFFSGSFCAIFWLKKRGLMLGLAKYNEFISRDEGLHGKFACLKYNQLQYCKLKEEVIHEIIDEAVNIECEFISDVLPVDLIGMNVSLMVQYIKFVADALLFDLGCSKMYNVPNPFDFMQLISLNGKTNFFEDRVSEYRKANTMNYDHNGEFYVPNKKLVFDDCDF